MSRVYIGLGSNIEPRRHLAAALDRLAELFGELLLSPVYESAAIGFDGPAFLNSIVGVDTDYTVAEMVATLRQIECDNGYCGGAPKFSSRSLDLDLLVHGDLCGVSDGIELPRPDMTKYAYVLWPLADIAGAELHPRQRVSYFDLKQRLAPRQQLRWVPFQWHGRDLSAALARCAG
jgi:2-amino-4-hydroxy-6-hydroxymethyldihydropteridine diphosphokinase